VKRWWSFAVYLLLPYAIVSLVWRGFRYRAYWSRWSERFGFVGEIQSRRVIWVHAVSVGEVRSAAALIEAIRSRLPRHQVVVTTMTPTGAEQVAAQFGQQVTHAYVPYDFPDAVGRFLDRVRPELAVIAETEFWPNLFAACSDRNIPINLVNVRLSQSSFRGYSWVPQTVRRMFTHASLICAQTLIDAQRLRNLGVDPNLIEVTGNLKFDVAMPEHQLQEGRALRAQWGRDRPVLIAASTHPGEEGQVLAAYAQLRSRFSNLLLVLVPRHPERFQAVVRQVRRAGYETAQRSQCIGDLQPSIEVLVGDTMGELYRMYAASDVAFIGGSLIRHGGQNLLEACSVGVPVIFGPHMFNFEEISAMALARGAARQVRDSGELADAVALYFDQPALRSAAAGAAQSLIDDNHGARARTMELLSERSLHALDSVASSAESRAKDAPAI
jgi:3-deoxy-D-manno-octulosonic-acid transferase